MTEDEADVVVLGLGGLGSAAAYWLARGGARVIGLERFALGHDRGASQDHSRIIRLSYHDAAYVRLAQAAYDSWAEVAAESGDELVIETGGIDIFPAAAGAFDRSAYTGALDACGVPYERLDAAEAMRRFPELRVGEATEVLFQARTGIAAAARANAAHQRLARAHGADLREHARVEAISAGGGEVTVRAGGRTIRAGKLVLCAGPWTNDVLALLGRRLNLVVTREQVVYLEPQDAAAFAPERFPVWIWMQEPCYYGFPVFGEPAVKVAQDGGGAETTADARSFAPDEDNARRVVEFMRATFPRSVGSVRLVKTCLYTLPPDRDFVLDRLPGHDDVFLAVGAGHAFKFATQIGRILTELALTGETAHDLSLFRADRGVLHDFAAERTWSV
ncbi:MAG TPA: N-methyl-L-tryptophan oxidase [Gaiellales bacterium]